MSHSINMNDKGAHWNHGHEVYTCTNGIRIACKFNRVDVDAGQIPQNGLWLRRGETPVLVVS